MLIIQLAGISSLRLYADDTTQYAAHMSPVVLESTLNHDVIKLTQWFYVNHLQVNAAKTQAMTLGKSQFTYRFSVEDKILDIEPTLKILGVTLDKDLDYKPHVDIMLKKAYAKIAALCKTRRFRKRNWVAFMIVNILGEFEKAGYGK